MKLNEGRERSGGDAGKVGDFILAAIQLVSLSVAGARHTTTYLVNTASSYVAGWTSNSRHIEGIEMILVPAAPSAY